MLTELVWIDLLLRHSTVLAARTRDHQYQVFITTADGWKAMTPPLHHKQMATWQQHGYGFDHRPLVDGADAAWLSAQTREARSRQS